MSAAKSFCNCKPPYADNAVFLGAPALLSTGGLCNAICIKCNVGVSYGVIVDLSTLAYNQDTNSISAKSRDKYAMGLDDWKASCGSIGEATHEETAWFLIDANDD